MLQDIFKYSTHLHMVLRREFGDSIPGSIEESFALAIQHGGLKEIDFSREEGVSYNPRPARIALILLNDAKVREAVTISAALLAASDFLEVQSPHNNSELNQQILELAALARRPPEMLRTTNESQPSACEIGLALHLDRARHRHQATNPDICQKNKEFLAETKAFIELAESIKSPLHRLLDHWYKSFGSNLVKASL